MSDSIAIDSRFRSAAATAGHPVDSSSPNSVTAIARCILAKQNAYKKELAKGADSYRAIRAGHRAFIGEMPPLAGLENIRNFVSCVAHAMVTGILIPKDAAPLLADAKAALDSLRHKPQLSGAA